MLTTAFTFLSADGKSPIHAVRWAPDSGRYSRVLQITHGMVEYIGRYEPFAQFLTEQGFLVTGMDLLGHGASVLSEDRWGYFAEKEPKNVLCRDIRTLRDKTRAENPDLPYFMLGHSMGSYLLRSFLGTYGGEGLSGAVIVGTGFESPAATRLAVFITRALALIRGWEYRSPFIEGLTQGAPYRRFDLTGKDTANSWLTKDEKIVAAYYADPRCRFRFTLNGYLGLFQAVLYSCGKQGIRDMPRELPLLLVSGEDDPVGNLGKGVRKLAGLYRETGCRDVSCKLYSNDRHELLNETDRDRVYADILTWLDGKTH